jgi:hypothetical protein
MSPLEVCSEVGKPVDDVSNPAALEGKLRGLGMDQDGKARVQNIGDRFYTKGYLCQSNFNYNKSS